MKRTVRSYLYPYRFAFLLALIQVAFIIGLELLKPWPIKIIIDHVLSGNPVPWSFIPPWSPETLLLFASMGLVAIYLLLSVFHILSEYMTVKIGQGMVNDLRRDLYSHIQRLSLSFHNRQQIGDLLYRVTSDTLTIQQLMMNGVFTMLSALLLLIGMFVIMLLLDWYLTLLAMAVCPVLFAAIAMMNNKVSLAATQALQKESTVYSLAHRTLSAIRVVQAFTQEEEERRRFLQASQDSLAADLWLYTLENLYHAVVNVTIAAGTASVLWLGTRQVFSGDLTVGEIVVFVSYLASLYGPLDNIVKTYTLIQRAQAGIHRAFEILELEPSLPEGHKTFPPSGAKGEISFEQVSFGYDVSHQVLKKINLHIASGEKIAVVGPTGAGKSTLVSLLPRFYDPQQGRLTIDGVDVREFQLKSLRQQIAMILQPPLVFPFSVRDNIAYGRPDASMAEIVAAARIAQIHESITRLPQGYATIMGEQGANLSEGEKLRLTIARGILRNAPILILDEPTASVDAETEALIMEGLQQLMSGRTTIIIAHRLSTIRQADLIVVLRGGDIVERGSFDELMRRVGPFASLYRTQFGLHGQKETLRIIQ